MILLWRSVFGDSAADDFISMHVYGRRNTQVTLEKEGSLEFLILEYQHQG